MKSFKNIFALIFCLFLLTQTSKGQTDPPPPPPPPAPCTPTNDPFDPCVPIDGGVSILIAAVIGIGARKAYQERNKAKGLHTNND
jgi:hypothetical protein